MIELERGSDSSRPAPRTLGLVQEVQFFGSFWRIHVQRSQGATLLVDLPVHSAGQCPQVGDTARLYWPDAAMHPIPDSRAEQTAA